MISIPSAYISEMQIIKKSISSYPGYEAIASCLGEFVNQNIVAGLIGCIVPESGTNHRILNAKEYNGRGASGTSGWNCGEGLIQWTYWKNKRPLIVRYNNDSRSTQKLPTDWATYSQGTPVKENGALVAVSDGKHIAGLSLHNQMLFLVIYYNDVIKKLANEQNLAVIVAKIYQHKAGMGYYSNISDPITRAYITAKNKYSSSSGNHYLQSLKIAQEYLGSPIEPSSVTISENFSGGASTTSPNQPRPIMASRGANKVYRLSDSTNDKNKRVSDRRKENFANMVNGFSENAPELGRNIIISSEMYGSEILKEGQKPKINGNT